ncbi:MAG: hypothetical protein K6F82_03340 [Sphaerochaetaceae bacterium]|nr:hypothetical protein [Sphaerochaetaceae bacterium]
MAEEKKGNPPKEAAKATVFMTREIFTEFAKFDTFRLKKMWKKPALLTLGFVVISGFAYFRLTSMGQSPLLAFTLLAFGLFLPLYNYLKYMKSVKNMAVQQEGREAYTLLINKAGLTVTAPENVDSETKTATFRWNKLIGAYRLKHSICLFPDLNHAFLFPTAEESSSLAWKIIEKNMEKEKVHG